MSFWAIFLVLHFASLLCGNPLFGCYKGGEHPNIIYIYIYMGKIKYVPNHQPDILNHYDSNWHTNDPLIAAIAVPWAHLGVTGPVHLGPKCWPWASYLPQNLHLSPRVRMLALLGMVWWSLCSSNLPFLKFLKAMFFEDNPSQLPHQLVTIAGNLGKGLVAQASYWYA